ncbi:alanine dehydrogenase [Rhodothermaceae bacterium RA]|nr:alanine dehydrogenase [Rhodothermaceae bacterium RA]
MKELLDMLNRAGALQHEGRPFAVGTVVRIGGSTYRRPGARMLVAEDGRRWGTVSGGCLEGEVAQRALHVLETSRPELLPFDLDDDDLIFGFGTGCNGVAHVLLEPVPVEGRASPIDLLNRCVEDRHTGLLATVIDVEPGLQDSLARHLLLLDDGSLHGDLEGSPLFERVRDHARHVMAEHAASSDPYVWETQRYTLDAGKAEVLYERVLPPVRLVIFGEGHDVGPLVRFAAGLGWRVQVVGRKPAAELQERFPDAEAWTYLMHPEDAPKHVTVDSRTAVLVMNHTYLRDRRLLQTLLQATPLRYIGMLGPRERTARIITEVEMNQPLTDDQRARIYGPIGLDIGTETPEEIALATLAEVQAVLHGRPAGFLREREAPIHGGRAGLPTTISSWP